MVCQGKPADVMFLLDSSGSIWFRDFARQLAFVQSVVDVFDVQPNMTRVGVISYSNWAVLDFSLNNYTNQADVHDAISQIEQIRGDTDTAGALNFLREECFTPEAGARDGVPHIAIVLTDGKSNVPATTLAEAQLTRAAGIHLFAIGVGKRADRHELVNIASQPSSKFVHQVGDFASLQYIKDMLAIETCLVTDPPTTLPPPTTTVEARMLEDQACGASHLTDIVLAVSPTSSRNQTNAELSFYRKVVRGFSLDTDLIRVALVPKKCPHLTHDNMEDSTDDKLALLSQLNAMLSSPESGLDDTVRYMWRRSFRAEEGGRPEAKRIGVLVVGEGDSKNMREALREAFKARIMAGVELFVVGVGKSLNPKDLRYMGTQPPEQHVFHVTNHQELSELAGRLRHAICPGLTQ